MAKNETTGILAQETAELLKEIILKHNGYGRRDAIMAVLNDVQAKLGYLPYEAQRYIAVEMDIPLAEIFGIVTFYSGFSLNPVGKYKIAVCMGTACYVKDAHKILAKIEQKCGIKAGETSEDGLFTIVATRCIGACGLAPVITINENVYGKLHLEDVDKVLEKYK
ncbi:MAG: NAD(P)H-dependent oxidoreductase subunit E [Defluviitaleaceae bacterium]|nr:NAD(P)H-dependent oxidoreductase subunit E [Defluviitaleaceae bacterium]MCL2835657.1 NAD(P)H-dependent oxidoreductase subunit E [Defluviitaleaceae bacterium]